jgi:alkanesulfonate monooxygenase SsuD/methylene tetrahydromethanopterin reductase-like flavin-dependent oxidoreductase (luciferase family)
MTLLRRTWSGEPYGEGVGPIGPLPATPGGPEVLFGGFAPAAIERVGRFGDGFLGAALPPRFMTGLFRDVERVWQKYDRPGRPRLVAQVSVALGPASTVERARRNLLDYYGFSGHADQMANGLFTTPHEIRAATDALLGIGADEVMLYCWSSDPDQVDRLTDAVF